MHPNPVPDPNMSLQQVTGFLIKTFHGFKAQGFVFVLDFSSHCPHSFFHHSFQCRKCTNAQPSPGRGFRKPAVCSPMFCDSKMSGLGILATVLVSPIITALQKNCLEWQLHQNQTPALHGMHVPEDRHHVEQAHPLQHSSLLHAQP